MSYTGNRYNSGTVEQTRNPNPLAVYTAKARAIEMTRYFAQKLRWSFLSINDASVTCIFDSFVGMSWRHHLTISTALPLWICEYVCWWVLTQTYCATSEGSVILSVWTNFHWVLRIVHICTICESNSGYRGVVSLAYRVHLVLLLVFFLMKSLLQTNMRLAHTLLWFLLHRS